MKLQIKKQMAALLSMAVIAVQFPHAALAETVVPDNKTIESFSVHADTASPSQAEQETDVIVKDHSDPGISNPERIMRCAISHWNQLKADMQPSAKQRHSPLIQSS